MTTSKAKKAADVVAESSAVRDDDSVTITLAHPISREQDKTYLGLPVDKDYGPGDKVTVNRSGAQSLIGSGLAAVDPEDAEAVRATLNGEQPEVEKSGNEPQGTNA